MGRYYDSKILRDECADDDKLQLPVNFSATVAAVAQQLQHGGQGQDEPRTGKASGKTRARRRSQTKKTQPDASVSPSATESLRTEVGDVEEPAADPNHLQSLAFRYLYNSSRTNNELGMRHIDVSQSAFAFRSEDADTGDAAGRFNLSPQKCQDRHPIFGIRVLAAFGRELYVASARTFISNVPLWLEQRPCDMSRVQEIVKQKRDMPLFPGVISVFQFPFAVPVSVAVPQVAQICIAHDFFTLWLVALSELNSLFLFRLGLFSTVSIAAWLSMLSSTELTQRKCRHRERRLCIRLVYLVLTLPDLSWQCMMIDADM